MRRVDLPEGSERTPWNAYGRIRSDPKIDEGYATITVFGWIIFVACGRYNGRRYSLRWWTGRRVMVKDNL